MYAVQISIIVLAPLQSDPDSHVDNFHEQVKIFFFNYNLNSLISNVSNIIK